MNQARGIVSQVYGFGIVVQRDFTIQKPRRAHFGSPSGLIGEARVNAVGEAGGGADSFSK